MPERVVLFGQGGDGKTPAETGLFQSIMQVLTTWQNIGGFEEKPKETKLRYPQNPEKVAGSMGVYLFNYDVLIPVLLKDAEDPNSSHDFGKDILPKMVDTYRVFAYDFVDENKQEARYWRDVGTLEAYYEANMDVV